MRPTAAGRPLLGEVSAIPMAAVVAGGAIAALLATTVLARPARLPV